jgi:hypothetical protein
MADIESAISITLGWIYDEIYRRGKDREAASHPDLPQISSH